MPSAIMEPHLKGIAQLVVHQNLMSKGKALEYQRLAESHQQSLLPYLVENHILDAKAMALMLAQNFGTPFFNLDSIDYTTLPMTLVNDHLISQHAVIPLSIRGNQLFLATDDPSNQTALKQIQFQTGLQVSAIVVETDKLSRLIDQVLRDKASRMLTGFVDDALVPNNNPLGPDPQEQGAAGESNDDAPIVKFVNQIIMEALNLGASDIHFEPYESSYRIRFRQDGILREVAEPPLSLSSRLASRIKIMSNLDISERRVPQDGGFKLHGIKNRAIDVRVSTCPTMGGEKVVMRLLDTTSMKLDPDDLGLSALQREQLLTAIKKPQGMILVTGPTGSGKTVTLYTALNILNTKDVNISTVEDPVEIKLSGINQVNINPKAGLTFSNTLRAFLRQDPDIIMVGEIRDQETAEIAIKAAQTGHLVLSTLHTNSAADTVTRLRNMGVLPYNLVSSIRMILAQRLVRKLCDACKQPRHDLSHQSLIEMGFTEEELQTIQLHKAMGCRQCSQGYRGRIGIFEILPLSNVIADLILSGGNSHEILRQAQAEGMLTLYQSGLTKVKEGLTTLEEVNRVCYD
jgi:type IV pilus assembly protein PilB